LFSLLIQVTIEFEITEESFEFFFEYFLQALQYNKWILSLNFSQKEDSLYWDLSHT
tara:strand:- start:1596 stop:1763 length:168 start_codon:yes stop_codon:yes gene_type:complete